jgi:hypothetical protein
MPNNYNSTLQSNNTDLQAILNTINELPNAGGGTTLPTLTNEGSASDLLSGKQLIDSDGEVVTGTIPTKTSSNLSASGATVTVPAGYYASQATKSVATATQATPSVSISTSGLITASATQSAGYVTAGTKSGTKQLTTQAAKTVTPTKSSQTAVASGRYTTGAVTVAAIPSQYITTTDATAAAADIRSGKTAYVNGSKRTGTIADFDGSYTCSGESTGGGGSGGGASIETCTVTIGNASQTVKCCYTDANMTIQNCIGSKTITVPQNTLLFCLEPTTYTSFYVSGNCQIEFSNFTMMCLKVHGDCSIAAHVGTESGGS